jgi:membrane associated rhomboid family serine protease
MSLTVIIIAITVLISFWGWNRPDIQSKLMHTPYRVFMTKEYYRLLSSGFIHADYMHLLLNMYGLYIFGDVVERSFEYTMGGSGKFYFLLLYILGIIISSVPDTIQHKNHAYFNSLGASGGVSSIVFASVIISPLTTLMMIPIPLPMPAYVFAVLYLLYSIYMDKKQANNVNHMAHVWGALWGVVFMFLVFPSSITSFFQQILTSFNL